MCVVGTGFHLSDYVSDLVYCTEQPLSYSILCRVFHNQLIINVRKTKYYINKHFKIFLVFWNDHTSWTPSPIIKAADTPSVVLQKENPQLEFEFECLCVLEFLHLCSKGMIPFSTGWAKRHVVVWCFNIFENILSLYILKRRPWRLIMGKIYDWTVNTNRESQGSFFLTQWAYRCRIWMPFTRSDLFIFLHVM